MTIQIITYVILHNDIYTLEICALLGFYTRNIVNSLPTFRENLSVPPSRVKKSKISWHMKVGTRDCPETSVSSYRHTLRNIPEDRKNLIYFGAEGRNHVPVILFVLSFTL